MEQALAFFGAFNPPTVAHLSLAEFALRQTGRKCVVFVPSQSAYIWDDQGKDFAYDNARRFSMLQAAAQSRSWMRVTDWELRQEKQPRTYETLLHLREEGIQAALLLGSDKLPELEHGWQHVNEIAREFGIVCLTRGDDACQELLRDDPYLSSITPYIQILDTPQTTRSVSSTAVRQRVAKLREIEAELSKLVPNEILPLLK